MKRCLLGLALALSIGTQARAQVVSFTYQGGPVVADPQIVAVYMGTPDPTFRTAMDRFYAEINRSRALAWLSEYSTSTQTIGRGHYVGSFVLAGPFNGAYDAFLVADVINTSINTGVLPFTGPDMIYVVHVAPGVVITFPPAGVCGIHIQTTRPGSRVTVAIVKDQTGDPCGVGLATVAANTHMTAYHEITESITDPGSCISQSGVLVDSHAWVGPWTSFCNPTEISDVGTTFCPNVTIATSSSSTALIEAQWSQSGLACITPPVFAWDTPSTGSRIALLGATSFTAIPVARTLRTGYTAFNNGIAGVGLSSTAFPAYAAGVSKFVGDFNADGRSDIALVGGAGWNTIPLAESKGHASFEATNRPDGVGGFLGTFGSLATVSGVTRLVGDFNSDGRSDLALIGGSTWNTIPVEFSSGDDVNGIFLGWMFSNGTGTVPADVATFNSLAAQSGVVKLVADFDRDGRDDIALVNQATNWGYIPVAYSNSTSTTASFTVMFQAASGFTSWATTAGAEVLLGEFDSDGRKNDLVLTGASGWTTIPVAVPGMGRTNFVVTNTAVSGFPGWAATSGAIRLVGDFDADGKSDIALTGISGWTTLPVAFSTGTGSWVVSNTSLDMTWTSGWPPSWQAASSTPGARFLIGDFDSDGKSDIAITGPGGWNNTVPLAFSNFTSARNQAFTFTHPDFSGFPTDANTSGAVPLVGRF